MAQLNVRVPDELLERLKAESKRCGAPAARIVRDAIEAKLPGNPFAREQVRQDRPVGIRTTNPAGSPTIVDTTLPNAIQLSGRTGMPRVICQRMLDEGRVSVGADGRWLLDGNSV